MVSSPWGVAKLARLVHECCLVPLVAAPPTDAEMERPVVDTAQKPTRRLHRLALLLAAALTLAALPASALTIQIDGITTAPGGDYTPNARLGTTSSLLGDSSVSHVVNYTDCKAIFAADAPTVRVTWSWLDKPVALLSPRYGVKLAPPGATCDGNSMTESNTDSGCKILASDKAFSQPLTAAGEFTDVDLSELLKGVDCALQQEVEARIYFITTDNSTGVSQTLSQTFNLLLDTKAPVAPTVETLSGGGQNIRLTWAHADTAVTNYARVYWSKVPFTASAPSTATNKSDKLTGTSYQIQDLDNGTTYYVAVTAIDGNDNESAANEVREGVPIEVQDFWQYYKASGGSSDAGYYGCSAGAGRGAGGWAGLGLILLAALLLLGARRFGLRRVALLLAFTGAALATWAPTAAQAESPRTASLDLRFGYYAPQVDNEFAKTNGQTPFDTVFGDSALQKGFSLEQNLLGGFGDLAIGFSAGWWSQTGKARALDGSSAQDSTELMIVPLTLDLVYRFNWLAFKTGFPLVPYVKGGLAYALWWSFDGNGDVSKYTGADNKVSEAQGGVAGLHGVVGLRLLLDVFEPRAARGFDLEMGVNHSYLFCEYQVLSLNNFGDAKALDLSDEVILFGLGFDL